MLFSKETEASTSARRGQCQLTVEMNIDLLQNEFRYDFRKGPGEISAGTEFTVFTVIKG